MFGAGWPMNEIMDMPFTTMIKDIRLSIIMHWRVITYTHGCDL
jgi:hypothetical protein